MCLMDSGSYNKFQVVDEILGLKSPLNHPDTVTNMGNSVLEGGVAHPSHPSYPARPASKKTSHTTPVNGRVSGYIDGF